jgi:hypothetical protein
LKCGWFFCPASGAWTRRSHSSASAIVAADERAKKRPAHLRVRARARARFRARARASG